MISLENFNEGTDKSLDSPRSLEACKRQGILPSELRRLSFKNFKKSLKNKNLDKKLMTSLWESYNKKRKEKLILAHEVLKIL